MRADADKGNQSIVPHSGKDREVWTASRERWHGVERKGVRARKCEWFSCHKVCKSLRGFPSLSEKWVYYSTMEV